MSVNYLNFTMSLEDADRRTVWISVSDVSSHEACVNFDPPLKISKSDIDFYYVYYKVIII
jgi:hypothetical protein